MKFILSEDLTLEEQKLLEAPLGRNSQGQKRARARNNEYFSNDLTQEEEIALSNYFKSKGYTDSRIEQTLEEIRTGNKDAQI